MKQDLVFWRFFNYLQDRYNITDRQKILQEIITTNGREGSVNIYQVYVRKNPKELSFGLEDFSPETLPTFIRQCNSLIQLGIHPSTIVKAVLDVVDSCF